MEGGGVEKERYVIIAGSDGPTMISGFKKPGLKMIDKKIEMVNYGNLSSVFMYRIPYFGSSAFRYFGILSSSFYLVEKYWPCTVEVPRI